jgi:DNA-binding NarL/FixJ family response regulator
MQTHIPLRLKIAVLHFEPLLRTGLVAALSSHADIEPLDVEGSGIASLESHLDVVITDITRGIELALEVRKRRRSGLFAPKVLALAARIRERDVRVALESGVQGLLPQGCAIDELLFALQSVVRGGRYRF